MSYSCAIIIPAIDINEDLKKCIKECLLQEKVKITIYLVTNKKIKNKFKNLKVKYLCCGDVNMSKKRNFAVKKSREKFIAFIDSDAYPIRRWIFNGINILNRKKNIGMVTGPDLPFKNQKGWSYYIGMASKSFLISGSKVYRKKIYKTMICTQASSCNMIFKKEIYEKVKGMDENIYIGEDKDLCDKFNNLSSILYSPKVKIYHKIREFLPFLFQRFSYGTSVIDIIKNDKKLSFNNMQYFMPLIILVFYVVFPFFLENKFLNTIFVLFLISINALIAYESLKISFNPKIFFKIFLIIKLNILSFGIGSLVNFLSIKNIKNIYTKR